MAGRSSIPTGARAFVAMSPDGARFTIRYAFPDEDPTTDRPRVEGTPTFTKQVEAYRYLDCLESGERYVYPVGAA